MSTKAQDVEIQFHLHSQLIHSLTQFDVKLLLRKRFQTVHTPYADRLRALTSHSSANKVMLLNLNLGVQQQLGHMRICCLCMVPTQNGWPLRRTPF